MPKPVLNSYSFTIAISTSLSDVITLSNLKLVMIQMPAAWDAANLTFQMSDDGTNFFNVYKDDGNELVVTAAASRAIVIDPSRLPPVPYLKIRSGTNGSPVNQTAQRVIKGYTKVSNG